MSRSSWKRVFTASLVVIACTWAVPAKAATTAPTMDSAYDSTMKLWTKTLDWLSGFWTAPAPSGAGRGNNMKFGAGHSSDGHSAGKASLKSRF